MEEYDGGASDKSTKSWWNEAGQIMRKGGLTSTATIFCIFMFIGGAVFATRWLDVSIITGASFQKSVLASRNHTTTEAKFKYELNCSYSENTTQTCPANYPKIINTSAGEESCPEYFRWIYEDLRPWQQTGGVSKEIVESGISKANMRVVILDGKLYLEQYSAVFQTRDVFSLWGLLQLLKFYPGKLPDVDFMFELGDMPGIPKTDYMNASIPPPVFHYCADDSTLDLVFPDWSFWGWYDFFSRLFN